MKNKKRKKTIRLGECDEDGKLLSPHTHYGIIRYLKFMFQKICKYKKGLLFLFAFGIFTQSIMRYLWSYIGKFLIDIVQAQAGMAQKDLHPLIQMLTFVVVVELVSLGGNVIVQNRVSYQFNLVRLQLMTEKNSKLLGMNYQFLEQPHILNLHQRAENAISSDYNGFGSLMSRSFQLGALIITMLVSATTIVVLNPRLILVLILGMMINYASQQWSIRDD